jgi:hypothetical protein
MGDPEHGIARGDGVERGQRRVPADGNVRPPARYPFQVTPQDRAALADRHLDEIALTSIALAFLEPDPEVDWDRDRITAVGQAIGSLSLPE